MQNYHRHSHYTNPIIADSVAKNEDYAKRAIELGHKIITTMEHGWQGRYIEGYELAKKHDLKFVFGTEAYWVKNRLEKDNTNAHICLFAKTEYARQCLNDILGEAAMTGFYYRQRIDLDLIHSLPSDQIICTSACVAGWKYEDSISIMKDLHGHFGRNFFLEVQYQNTDKQKELNKTILDLNIPLIAGYDSHYIYQDKAWERSEFIKSKKIQYPEEDGWFMDYPDDETAVKRFMTQGILNQKQIDEAMNNTDIFLEVQEYKNACFDDFNIKMPTLYPELSQEEKDKKYVDLVWSQWEKEKIKIDPEKRPLYEKEIQKEIDTVVITKHSDYFLLDYEIVKKGVEDGGHITPSGRGSGVSFYSNKLLGFTKVDRIASSVRMYPERFMSPTRILESKSLADLDLNLGNVDPFIKAQKELLGETSCYPMIAYGTMQKKAAWKMYARVANLDFDLANEVSEQIEKYEKAIKHAENDEKDEISLIDYVEEKYHQLLKDSEPYLGIISDSKFHTCAHLLFQGNIRREIGIIRIKKGICTVMDGKWAEKYKFLKNDLLKVSVVDLIYRVYKRLGIEPYEEVELFKHCDDEVWNMYKTGKTLGLNQVEQPGTSVRVAKYKPKNIAELCAFIAAIRPGFKSMYKKFEAREHFSYNIPTFDNLIQTPELPESFLLYQEMTMAALGFGGIPMSEAYEVIKAISKKRENEIRKYKPIFLEGFAKKIIEQEDKTLDQANSISESIWKIIENSIFYQFNASHSYSVAIDSLHGAFLKSKHPLYFYEEFLNLLDEDSKKDKISKVIQEAEDFKITFNPLTFRQDNRKFVANLETREIYKTLKSIKGIGSSSAETLFSLKDNQYEYFYLLLKDLKINGIDSGTLNSLIKINYFTEFGNIKQLDKINEYFVFLKHGEAKQISIDKIKDDELFSNILKRNSNFTGKTFTKINIPTVLEEISSYFLNDKSDYTLSQKMAFQKEYFGFISLTTKKEEDRKKLLILDLKPLTNNYGDPKPWCYSLETMSVGSGKKARLNINAKIFDKNPVSINDVILVRQIKKNDKGYWYIWDYERLEDI